jgi:uncharacterized protein YbjT (DUF2867 family)
MAALPSQQVLVTGASGYVGSRLVPVLLERGHRVTAGFRNPESAEGYWWRDQVDAVALDVLNRDSVQAAVCDIDAVYYLIHGMDGDDFEDNDRRGADNLARSAADQGIGRIVYLSGIVPPIGENELSDHLRSRLEVEQILAAGSVPAITLRAAILLGAGSTSLEIVRQISERLLVQTIPTWMDAQVQPIAIGDALEILANALGVAPVTRSFDIGGPEVLSYAELLQVFADVAGLRRVQVPVPGLPTKVVGKLVGVITDVPSATVEALIESLRHDMVCSETSFKEALLPAGYELLGLREALERALAPPDPPGDPREADPAGPLPADPDWAS